ncbi:hypothetical protein MWT96_20180 [Prescottella equi]|uniref:hypothetical protein n=2 Tax=Rhodococcus hoagii TaxID=43767 RepID=UPI0019FCF2FD|nr:hypothetical protein [Prescottella equi]MBM4496322.1 hypothetical protein [Prescottella equi]MBM4594288.1 hypothetical protein [Prescottella equi]NKU46666.1 hypothetical protein [Prescottella equi]NKW25598.1 hypothetical protein [Prescottella equi]NKW25675.1 hypothetical protein [Prescottella equi]
MYRRTAAAAIGVSSIVRGSSYLSPQLPDSSVAQLAFVDETIPLTWYAVGWIATGSIALFAAAWPHPRILGAAFGAGIGFNMLWALSFMASQVFLGVPRAYVSATSYFVIATLIFCVAALSERLKLPPAPRLGGDRCRGTKQP